MRRERESELHKGESIVTEVSGPGDAYVYVCHVWMDVRAGCQPGPRGVGISSVAADGFV
jgi:hypothetical protein